MPDTSYFTKAQFDAYLALRGASFPYEDDDLASTQDEVIELLENWARTSWANVDTSLTEPGDGVANEYRQFTEVFRGNVGVLLSGVRTFQGPNTIAGGPQILPLARYPVQAIDTFTVFGTVVDPSGYTVDGSSGRIIIEAPVPFDMGPAVVTYRYGFGTCPGSVRRYTMMAALSNLRGETKETKVPRNTTRITSGKTTLDLSPMDVSNEPWPWDLQATELIKAYWSRSRSRLVAAW